MDYSRSSSTAFGMHFYEVGGINLHMLTKKNFPVSGIGLNWPADHPTASNGSTI